MFGVDGQKLRTQKLILISDVNLIQLEMPAQEGLCLLNMVSNGKVIYKGKMIAQ
jgi:hypothetical protein